VSEAETRERSKDLIKRMRSMFENTYSTALGKVLADAVDQNYDANAPGEYNRLLREIFILVTKALPLALRELRAKN